MAHTECRSALEANQSCDILALAEREKIGVGGVMGDGEEKLQCSCVHLESMSVKSQSCSDMMDVGP